MIYSNGWRPSRGINFWRRLFLVREIIRSRETLVFVNNFLNMELTNISLRREIKSNGDVFWKFHILRMHFTTEVISKLKVFSCQILRNNVGKDTKAFHSFINNNAHWSVNNLKKMKIIELLYQSIHPSLVNRSQNDGLSHFPDAYPKKEFIPRRKTKQHKQFC